MGKRLRSGVILICMVLLLGLAGCGKEEKSMKEALEESKKTEAVEDKSVSEQEKQIAEQIAEAQKRQKEMEASVRAMQEERKKKEQETKKKDSSVSERQTQSSSSKSSDKNAGASSANKKICKDCGYERLEVQCGLCSGTGRTSSCKRCNGTGIICRNCFYPPSEPPASVDSSKSSSGGKGEKMCGRCHGEGYTGTCFSCGGKGYTSHSEFYDSFGTGGTTYEVTRPCYLCKNGKQKCPVCNGSGFVDK